MRFFYAVSVLSGTIIGAGLFALPYIAAQVGFGVILFYLLFLGVISILVHYFFAELALKTDDHNRLPGFAKIHFGSKTKNLAVFTGIMTLMGAMLAYIILGGQFLFELLVPFFGGNEVLYTLIYFILGSILIFFGIKAIERIEFLGVVGFVMVLILIGFRGWSEMQPITLFQIGENLNANLFLPYGAVLFSLWGAALIPEVEELLAGEKEKIRKVIPVSIILSILIYIVFTIIVVGITGDNTTQEAIVGLINHLDNGVIALALVFGLLATFTSFVTLALTLKKILWYDLGLSKNFSWALITFLPISLFLIGVNDYIGVISVVGAVFLAIEAILITLMYQKYKSAKYKFLTYPIIIIFILGIIFEFVYNKDVILSFL